MDKLDMIYDIVKNVNTKLDKHISDSNKPQDTGVTLKEYGIISGICTVICGTVVSVVQIIWG